MNLTELALKYGSDKADHHNHTPLYERYFEPIRETARRIVEIGIGGYEYPNRGGGSLKMWEEYFTKAEIRGIDIHSKIGLETSRIKTYVCDQIDGDVLPLIVKNADVIIDDASHMNDLTIKTFSICFLSLKPGGIYVIEDIDSSWATWANGDPDYEDQNNFNTTINFFRYRLNDVNAGLVPHYESLYPIESIHFYKNIIFIFKK